MSIERVEQLKVVEALVLASPEPISAARIAEIAPECTPALAKELVGELNERYEKGEHAFEIWEVAGGYQIRTRAEFSGYLQQLKKQRPLRLSQAALETLAVVAYRQPATRADIEYVRGVDSGAVLKSLMERKLVKIRGHKEVPGRPMLYGTTRRFLEVFGLESLKGLPVLRDLEELIREKELAAAEEAGAEGAVEEGEEEGEERGEEGVAEGGIQEEEIAVTEDLDASAASAEADTDENEFDAPADEASELAEDSGSALDDPESDDEERTS